MFINNLPMKTSTERFSTNNASGSTSQASAISEALELDASALILDEDTCATNFMIRDHRMRMLVSPDKEPITPFLSRVRSIYQEMGVSSILVIGGSGEYFDVADTVIMMDKYVPIDVTGRAKAISSSNPVPTDCVVSDGFLASPLRNRVPIGNCLDPFVRDRIKVKACSKKILMFGTEEIDIAAAEQLVELGQVSSIGNAMIGLRKVFEGKITLKQALQRIDQQINERGLDSLSSMIGGRLARPRLLELAAVLNRYRKLKCL
jgi:predicted ABC-class ATPase